MLYSVGLPGFVDILLGNNPGCGTPGFNATEGAFVFFFGMQNVTNGMCVYLGWDAVTGLGTPDFVKLKKLVG